LFLISPVGHPFRVADGGSPALLARLFGNDKDCRLRGASPEGAGRVEYRCAAIGHPKVLPGRLGAVSGISPRSGARGSGLGAVGGAELAQDVGHVRFDRVERHYQVAGDALVGLARGEQP
jgi:hypothetical protein